MKIILMKIMFKYLNTYSDVISDAITAISAIIITSLAIYGIREWQRQIKGKTNYEIARRYLKASLELRDALTYVRNPFIPLSEMKTALKEHGFDSEEYKDTAKTNRAVYSIRWKKVQEAWTKLEAELLEAEVSWGKDAVDAYKPLNSLVKKLFSAIQMYLEGERKATRDELIYDLGNNKKPDDFSKNVIEAVEKIREFLKPHLL